MQASLPSFCGLFKYRLDTSVVACMVCGGRGVDSTMDMMCFSL